MFKDILEQHFGPETGLPAPHITDAQIAFANIVSGTLVLTEQVSEHPVFAEQITDYWPDEGIKE